MPVYMIQTSEGDAIKIGCSSNVRTRFHVMQNCSPYDMTLLAIIDGGRKLEKELHERFASLRLRGEWFLAHPDMFEIAKGNEPPKDFLRSKKPGPKVGAKYMTTKRRVKAKAWQENGAAS